MSDALVNYENTKRTAPIPAGWMLTEPQNIADPINELVQFWNPIDQCWLKLVIDANGQPCEEFVKFWNGGATCLVVKDPNYVAPPPPASFGGFTPPFAVPSMPTFSVPQATPAPIAPVVAPAPVVAAPVVAPVVPAIPVPVAPVSQVQPVVAMAAPLVDGAGNTGVPAIPLSAPPSNVIPFPTSAAPVATAPVGIQADEEDEEDAQVSAADPNEVAAWLAARDGVKAQMAALEDVEKELRAKIVKVCFPNGLREGANHCALPDGRKLTVTGVVNRTVDDALVPTALDALRTHFGTAPTGLFRTKYEVGAKVFKGLAPDAKNLLSNVITEKQGAPQIKVSEPK